MAKVTGIGGIFFMANENNKELEDWYQRCLGFELQDWGGAVLNWPDDHAEDKGMTVWNIAAHASEWFAPSKARFRAQAVVARPRSLHFLPCPRPGTTRKTCA